MEIADSRLHDGLVVSCGNHCGCPLHRRPQCRAELKLQMLTEMACFVLATATFGYKVGLCKTGLSACRLANRSSPRGGQRATQARRPSTTARPRAWRRKTGRPASRTARTGRRKPHPSGLRSRTGSRGSGLPPRRRSGRGARAARQARLFAARRLRRLCCMHGPPLRCHPAFRYTMDPRKGP